MKLTIILYIDKNDKDIKNTILSIKNQTSQNFKLAVISNSFKEEELKSLVDKLDNVFLVTKIDLEKYELFNYVIQNLESDYFFILTSSFFLDEQNIELIEETIINNDIDFISTNWKILEQSGKTYQLGNYFEKNFDRNFPKRFNPKKFRTISCNYCDLVIENKVFNTHFIKNNNIKFQTKSNLDSQKVFLLDAILNAENFKYINLPILEKNISSNSENTIDISQNTFKNTLDEFINSFINQQRTKEEKQSFNRFVLEYFKRYILSKKDINKEIVSEDVKIFLQTTKILKLKKKDFLLYFEKTTMKDFLAKIVKINKKEIQKKLTKNTTKKNDDIQVIESKYEKTNPTNPPTVSVVIPTYKRRFLEKSIDSLLKQKGYGEVFNLEILVVFNGENFEYYNYLQNFYSNHNKYKDVQVIKSDIKGQASRNTGVTKSSGEFIMFVDDDDCITDGFIMSLLGYSHLSNIVVGHYSFGNNKFERLIKESQFMTNALSINQNKLISPKTKGFDLFLHTIHGRIYNTNFLKTLNLLKEDYKYHLDTVFGLENYHKFKNMFITPIKGESYVIVETEDSLMRSNFDAELLDFDDLYNKTLFDRVENFKAFSNIVSTTTSKETKKLTESKIKWYKKNLITRLNSTVLLFPKEYQKKYLKDLKKIGAKYCNHRRLGWCLVNNERTKNNQPKYIFNK